MFSGFMELIRSVAGAGQLNKQHSFQSIWPTFTEKSRNLRIPHTQPCEPNQLPARWQQFQFYYSSGFLSSVLASASCFDLSLGEQWHLGPEHCQFLGDNKWFVGPFSPMVCDTLLCSVQQEIESFEGNNGKPQLEASRLRRLEDEGERWGCWCLLTVPLPVWLYYSSLHIESSAQLQPPLLIHLLTRSCFPLTLPYESTHSTLGSMSGPGWPWHLLEAWEILDFLQWLESEKTQRTYSMALGVLKHFDGKWIPKVEQVASKQLCRLFF